MKHRTARNQSSRRGLTAAMLAALTASLCCTGPLVILGLGAGGAWLGTWRVLEPFRSYLMGLAVLSLGYAFYKHYGKQNRKPCDAGGECANPQGDRRGKLTLWMVTVLIAGLLAVPFLTPVLWGSGSDSTRVNSAARELELDIRGMTCTGCAVTIYKRLMKMEGIITAQIYFESGKAMVRFDSSKISPVNLLETIRELGYHPTISAPREKE